MRRFRFFACGLLLILNSSSTIAGVGVRGMNLSESDTYPYDANVAGEKTHAQNAIDQIKAMGMNHVILNPRAFTLDPKGSEITPRTPVAQRAAERGRYKRLIDYVHSQGMTVGIRPIFFVINKDGSTPYRELQPDGSTKIWWHGNIQPSNPNAWFQSFKGYLDIYLLIAQSSRVDEFTIGAELYSMTVGIEDQWKAFPHGFPGRWNALLKYARGKLGSATRIMYDINFTDDRVGDGGLGATGGELERWRYRLVDLSPPAPELVEFWQGLDAIGIDMYRSLASPADPVPDDYNSLVSVLQGKADEYASQLDTTMTEIQLKLGTGIKPVMFKEVGYRSSTRGYIDPFTYDSKNEEVNVAHQAAAYEAFLKAFAVPEFEWMAGVSFWDVAVDPFRKGPRDAGFSPIEKDATLAVLRKYLTP